MTIYLPPWFAKLNPDIRDDRALRNEFFIRQAALLSHPRGRLTDLAAVLNMSHTQFYAAWTSPTARLSPAVCIKINKYFGKGLLPPELIRPDIFGPLEK